MSFGNLKRILKNVYHRVATFRDVAQEVRTFVKKMVFLKFVGFLVFFPKYVSNFYP